MKTTKNLSISDYFLALYCKHKLNIKVKRKDVTLYG